MEKTLFKIKITEDITEDWYKLVFSYDGGNHQGQLQLEFPIIVVSRHFYLLSPCYLSEVCQIP
jgi:hypothetical protein